MKSIIISFAAILVLFIFIVKQVEKTENTITIQKFQPRSESQNDLYSPSPHGLKYFASLRGDYKTGIVNPQLVAKAKRQILSKNSRSGGIGLDFEFMGPINMGGQCRGIIVDRINNNKIYAIGTHGGVYISENGAFSWEKTWNENTNNVSCITQSTDGTLFAGTGCSFEGPHNSKGIYKSADGGASWNLITSTIDYLYVNAIAAHPIDPNTIAAATWKGLYITTDGGKNWSNTASCRNGTSVPMGRAYDVEWSLDGKTVYCAFQGGLLFYGSDYTKACGLKENANIGKSGRWAITVSPSKPNIAYAVTSQNGYYDDIKVSHDRGVNWASYSPSLPSGSAGFHLFGGQAEYDMSFLAVPKPGASGLDNLWIGGLDLWKYDGSWSLAATQSPSGQNNPSTNMHPDHHTIAYDPSDPTKLYFGNDGGVYKSFDGGDLFYETNNGYTSTQSHSISHANYNFVVAGLQDNGIININPFDLSNPQHGKTVTNSGVLNGDGFATAISQIADIKFTSSQFGNLGRGKIKSLSGMSACGAYCGMSSYVSQLGFWECKNDSTSKDSITFKVDTTQQNIGLGTGSKVTFQGKLEIEQNAAQLIPLSVTIGYNNNVLVYDGKGGFSGPGSGTFDSTNYSFTVTFNTPPSFNARINAFFTVRYSKGSTLALSSNSNGVYFDHILKSDLAPGDQLIIQDPVQSIITQPTIQRCNTQSDGSVICQDSSFIMNSFGFPQNGQSGLIMARNALDLNKNPEWIHLNVGNVDRHVFSVDGNNIYFANGSELRFLTGVNDLYTQADVDKIAPAIDPNRPNGQYSSYPSKRILSANGRISGIDINPKNPNEILVSVANYGAINHVYLVTRIPNTDNFTFVSIQGDLPDLPVYDVIYDADNPDQAILGTDLGIFTSTNIRAGSVEWVSEAKENGLHMVSIYDVDQQVLGYKKATNSGVVYVGTYGNGIWKSTSIVGLDEISHKNFDSDINSDITIYPNPLNQSGRMQVTVVNPENATIAIYDISGQLRKTLNPYLQFGDNDVSFDVNELGSGTYFMILTDGNTQKVAKFVVMK
ncbi:MAG: T9SS type A sorting domain-containing protein [Salibacteraceae bacterium]